MTCGNACQSLVCHRVTGVRESAAQVQLERLASVAASPARGGKPNRTLGSQTRPFAVRLGQAVAVTEGDAEARRQRLQAAGTWLRAQRETLRWTGSEFARRLGLNQTRVSAYERGQYEVSDEAAERIAEVLGIPLIETRRQLGLWAPDGFIPADREPHTDLTQISDEVLVAELARRLSRSRPGDRPES